MVSERAESASADEMRAVRRRWASGVAVVLVRDDAGYRGATLSAFTTVSLEPPLVLLVIDREGQMADRVPAAGAFTVSVLDRSHEFLAERFAGRAPLAPTDLAGVPHELTPAGRPVLTGALAWFDCTVVTVHPGGDHLLVLGAVTEVGSTADTDDPLLYYEGRYRAIEAR